jgi:GTPase
MKKNYNSQDLCSALSEKSQTFSDPVSSVTIGRESSGGSGGPRRAICVGLGLKPESLRQVKDHLVELIDLTHTAGAEVVGSLVQILPQWNPSFLIGSGKAEEIRSLVLELEADLVVLDHHLSGSQARNLEKIWGVRVLDRSQIILDIFAQRARTFEGKLQVELAQMMDLLPRMVGAWMDSLSRQGGGIGTRGPGETALENDKRRIRKRIQIIKKKLDRVKKNRLQNRESRKKSEVLSFALVGYTNSGKSLLLQNLTGVETFVQNQLFATLDPTTRKIFLGSDLPAVITDTVGFIHKIPPQLIEAFKATLEESQESDVLLHVIDLSHPNRDSHREVVESLIEEFGWEHKKKLYVYNKCDLASPLDRMQVKGYPRVFVSALTGEGLPLLKDLLKDMVTQQDEEVELYFKIQDHHRIFDLTQKALILKQEPSQYGTLVRAKLKSQDLSLWKEFLL